MNDLDSDVKEDTTKLANNYIGYKLQVCSLLPSACCICRRMELLHVDLNPKWVVVKIRVPFWVPEIIGAV